MIRSFDFECFDSLEMCEDLVFIHLPQGYSLIAEITGRDIPIPEPLCILELYGDAKDIVKYVYPKVNKRSEVYPCPCCRAFGDIPANIVFAPKGTQNEPCNKCRSKIEEWVADPEYIWPESCKTTEDCVRDEMAAIIDRGYW